MSSSLMEGTASVSWVWPHPYQEQRTNETGATPQGSCLCVVRIGLSPQPVRQILHKVQNSSA